MRFSQRLINPAPGSSIPGDFKPPVSLGVHDDLMTKVAYFNDGEKSALLVVADFVEMFRGEVLSIREYLSENTGIALDAVMFCGTHTHSGGMVLGFPPFTYTKTDMEYVNFIRDMTLEAAKEAMEKAEGSHDPDVAVLRVDNMEGKPLGVITNFACHATAHHENYFSSDYPAGTAQAVTSALGEDVVSFFINGACGNVTHIDWEERVFTKDELARPDHHIRIGGVRICAFPAELFYEYAIDLKQAESGEKIMVATIANGVLGYIPTRQAFVNGGYENFLGFTSNSEEACGDKLVQSVIRQIEQMKASE